MLIKLNEVEKDTPNAGKCDNYTKESGKYILRLSIRKEAIFIRKRFTESLERKETRNS